MGKYKQQRPSLKRMDNIIICRNSQGIEVRATPLRMGRHAVVFEVYNPYSILQLSEVLSEFKIIMNDQVVYSGRAVVSNLLNTGIMLVCEAMLDEDWIDVKLFDLSKQKERLQADFDEFLKEWKKIHIVLPDYKIIVADMQNFFVDLRRWLEQVELSIRSSPSSDWLQIERQAINELAPSILPSINGLFHRFEEVAQQISAELQPIHHNYAKRQLHPQVLCSPFAYRTYQKPLGYAGDYEMVNMILRDPLEGSSLFAKIVNLWFLKQMPAEAHRNRIKYIAKVVVDETSRIAQQDRVAQVFNLGCGPSEEIQRFLIQQDLCEMASFTLLDFNDETLRYTGKVLETLKAQYGRNTMIRMIKKSVHQILKEAAKPSEDFQKYDLIYCAGLFDYLSTGICKRLMNSFYDMLAPGGLLVATNVDISNPERYGMEYLLGWHLVHRNAAQLRDLHPDRAPPGSCCVKSDETGVNIYIEARKPSGH